MPKIDAQRSKFEMIGTIDNFSLSEYHVACLIPSSRNVVSSIFSLSANAFHFLIKIPPGKLSQFKIKRPGKSCRTFIGLRETPKERILLGVINSKIVLIFRFSMSFIEL